MGDDLLIQMTPTHFAANILKVLTGSTRKASMQSSMILEQKIDHTTISRAASVARREKDGNQRIQNTFIIVAATEYCEEHGIRAEVAQRILTLWMEGIGWDWCLYQSPDNEELLAEDAEFVADALEEIEGDDLLAVVVRSTLTLHGARNSHFGGLSKLEIAEAERALKRVIAENAVGYADASFDDLVVSGWISDHRTDLTALLLSTALLAVSALTNGKGEDVWLEFLSNTEAEMRLPLFLVRGLYLNDPVQLLSAAEAIWFAGRHTGQNFDDTVDAVSELAKSAWNCSLKTLPGYETYLDQRFLTRLESKK